MAEMLNTIQIKSLAQQIFGDCAVISDGYEGNGVRVVKIVVGKKGNLGYTMENAKQNKAPEWVDDVRTFHLTPLTDEQTFRKKLQSIVPFLPENRIIDAKEVSLEAPKMTAIQQNFGTPRQKGELYANVKPGAIAGLSDDIPKDLSAPIVVEESQETRTNPLEVKIDGLSNKLETLTDAILKLVEKPKQGRPKKIKEEKPKV